jgi:hypothetical protein
LLGSDWSDRFYGRIAAARFIPETETNANRNTQQALFCIIYRQSPILCHMPIFFQAKPGDTARHPRGFSLLPGPP